MNIQNEEQEFVDNSAYNPFPEPQTIPSGWDLTGIISVPQADSDTQTKDSSEPDTNQPRSSRCSPSSKYS